jgi:signal peptidase II
MKPIRNLWRLTLVGTILFGCVGCDQLSKEIVRAHLAFGEAHAYLGDVFRLVHVENTGAFLGLGASLAAPARVVVFQGIIGVVILGLLWLAFRPETPSRRVAGFALLAASGIGNLIDRLLFEGRVTDFLNIGIGDLRTGIFNIADVAGLFGFAVLLLSNSGATPAAKSP